MHPLSRSSIAVAVALAASAANAQTVVDGDTIDYMGVVVHLWGIDAPGQGQVCADGWKAGDAALAHLKELMNGRKVVCDLRGTDNAPRVAALCTADGKDLSAAMAGAGMAWARTKETDDYTVQETDAMAQVRGVHAHPCGDLRKR
jgi:endonuclease YncB( thermonuclease family)